MYGFYAILMDKRPYILKCATKLRTLQGLILLQAKKFEGICESLVLLDGFTEYGQVCDVEEKVEYRRIHLPVVLECKLDDNTTKQIQACLIEKFHLEPDFVGHFVSVKEKRDKYFKIIHPCYCLHITGSAREDGFISNDKQQTTRTNRRAKLIHEPAPLATPRIKPSRENRETQKEIPLQDLEREIQEVAQANEPVESDLSERAINVEVPEQEDIRQRDTTTLYGKFFETREEALSSYSKLTVGSKYLRQETENRNVIVYKCPRRGCKANLTLQCDGMRFQVLMAEGHTCLGRGSTKKSDLDDYIKALGRQSQLSGSYFESVRAHFRDPLIPDLRIRRRHNKLFGMARHERLLSWRKLPGLVEAIERTGGTAIIVEDGMYVNFVAIMPDFTHTFVQSDLFFGVIATDGTFHCGIGRGQLLAVVCLTGSRTILPLAWVWSLSEDKNLLEELFDLMSLEERQRVRTVISDGGTAICAAVKEKFGDNVRGLCGRHLQAHLSKQCASSYWKMLQSRNRMDYETNKSNFEKKYPEDFQRVKFQLKYLSRFEMNTPRDDLYTNGIIESFNSVCNKWRNCEPFDLLKNIYFYSRAVILQLVEDNQSGLTKSAYAYMIECAQIASRLKLKEVIIGDILIYEDEWNLFYQVDLTTNRCSCGGLEEKGLPCPHLVAGMIRTGRSWSSTIHPRYRTESIGMVYQQLPISIDFTQILADERELKPPREYSLVSKKKRALSVIDYQKKPRKDRRRKVV